MPDGRFRVDGQKQRFSSTMISNIIQVTLCNERYSSCIVWMGKNDMNTLCRLRSFLKKEKIIRSQKYPDM